MGYLEVFFFFFLSFLRPDATDDRECKACKEWLGLQKERLMSWVLGWEERIKPNTPQGWDSWKESGGIDDIMVRSHSCDLGRRGAIKQYALMCQPLDYGPDVV